MLLLMNEMGVGSVGLVTDLSKDDVYHFSSTAAISEDDVLQVHKGLHLSSFIDNI